MSALGGRGGRERARGGGGGGGGKEGCPVSGLVLAPCLDPGVFQLLLLLQMQFRIRSSQSLPQSSLVCVSEQQLRFEVGDLA